MDENEYHNILDELLESLLDIIETADTNELIEVDYQDGMMNIELQDGEEFVINKHSATQQLWMSSPYSGASHYEYEPQKQGWINTKNGEEFLATLANDLINLTGIKIPI